MAVREDIIGLSAAAPIPTEDGLLDDVSGLVSPPSICLKLYGLIQSPNATADEIGELVSLDPNLTARLLKIVNSAYYGFHAQIDTVGRAVTVLGTRDLFNLVLAISAVRSLSGLETGLVEMDRFWSHSIFCGLIARQLAEHTGFAKPERLFVAGLLHDIGSPVIYTRLPEWGQVVRSRCQESGRLVSDIEHECFGFTHASVGARLLESWELPAALRDAIRHHHDGGTPDGESAVLHVADHVADRSQIGSFWGNIDVDGGPADDDLFFQLWSSLGLGVESLDPQAVIERASQQFSELAGLFVR